MHEFNPFFNGSSLYLSNLTFAHHVHNFVSFYALYGFQGSGPEAGLKGL